MQWLKWWIFALVGCGGADAPTDQDICTETAFALCARERECGLDAPDCEAPLIAQCCAERDCADDRDRDVNLDACVDAIGELSCETWPPSRVPEVCR